MYRLLLQKRSTSIVKVRKYSWIRSAVEIEQEGQILLVSVCRDAEKMETD